MRYTLALVGLMILGACGGDDTGDVTSPPESGTFTLTVTGEGTGSGRVVTDAGISPAIDCSLTANAEPTGVCSGRYTEGASIGITAAPATGSTFAGWGGDASSCATTLSCALNLDGNKTAVAEFATVPSTGGNVEIISSAWYPEPDFFGDAGVIIWMAEVRNNTSQVIETAKLNFASHDAAGTVLVSDFAFVGPIPPGETRANESFADYVGTEATVDIQISDVRIATEDPNLASAQIVSSNYRVDPEFAGEGAIIWTVEVQNMIAEELESVQVDFITYDAAGQILEYDFTILGPIPGGGKQAAEGLADLHGNEATVNYQIASVTHGDFELRH